MVEPKVNEKKVAGRNAAIALGIICIVLVAGLVGTFAHYVLMISDKNNTISSLNTQISSKDSQISQLSTQISTLNSTISSLNSSVHASQLLSNYIYDSGPFTLGPYPNNDSWTYRDLSIAGYRQVSVFVSFGNLMDVSLVIRVGMGDFTGAHPGGYNWATYYNITTITGQAQPPFTQTIDVRGPQLTIEIYNIQNYSIDIMHIAVYATC